MTLQKLLIDSTTEMFASGMPLMSRILPEGGEAEVYAHYPPDDVVNGPNASRYFYHSHPPEQRETDEHGHFHFFLGKEAFSKDTPALIAPPLLAEGQKRADVVHLAALAIGYDGLPLRWFGTNRWVTDEWLYPAEAVINRLSDFDLTGPAGDPLVNTWLTAIFQLSLGQIEEILRERDTVLKAKDMTGEDRQVEVTGQRPVDLESLLG